MKMPNESTRIVHILGSVWHIREVDAEDNPVFADDEIGGYTDPSSRNIWLRRITPELCEGVCNTAEVRRSVLRHELIHAMLFESGLNTECAWANDEECVDWIALQFDKLARLFREADPPRPTP